MASRKRSGAAVLLATGVGAAAARAGYAALRRRPPGAEPKRWQRLNFRGEQVTLLAGPACALATAGAVAVTPGLSTRTRVAGVLAAAGAGACGVYDDLAGDTDRRGLRGHLSALAHGELTTGGVKVLGIGAVGLVAGALLRRGPGDTVLDKALAGVVVAGSANLLNLFDLRPGRAVKVGIAAGLPGVLRGGEPGALAAAAVGASAALLPDDLGERAMLGDAGSNALGAVLGTAIAAGASRAGLLAHAAGIVGLTATSEKVSFTKVIANTPALRWFDELGRRAAPGQPPAKARRPIVRLPRQSRARGDAAVRGTVLEGSGPSR
jgi:UDP-GlcNAc:undecaprenyl-phosphate GlcNAc-1-phosphate transferase